jgi:hypothetical protein
MARAFQRIMLLALCKAMALDGTGTGRIYGDGPTDCLRRCMLVAWSFSICDVCV